MKELFELFCVDHSVIDEQLSRAHDQSDRHQVIRMMRWKVQDSARGNLTEDCVLLGAGTLPESQLLEHADQLTEGYWLSR